MVAGVGFGWWWARERTEERVLAEGRDWISEWWSTRVGSRLAAWLQFSQRELAAAVRRFAEHTSDPFLPYHHITSLPSSIALGILALVACRQQRPQWPRHLHLELQR